jgi:transposase
MWSLAQGLERSQVALFCNVNEKTLVEWIHRFNGSGIDGLIDRHRKGAPRKISQEAVKENVLSLLDEPAKVGQEHWTAVKLHGYLTEEWQLEVGHSTLVRYLHEQNRCLRVPRPMPEPPDRDAWNSKREVFKAKLSGWVKDPAVELWFGDESGIEGDPRPRKRWVVKGSSPTIPYAGKHLRRNVIGAVCPDSGELSCLIFSHCDTDVFQAFLNNMAYEVPPKEGVRQILILDNASWHKSKRLIERFWLRLKSDYFSDFFAKTSDELEDRIIEALKWFFQSPDTVASQCAISGNF